MRVGRMTLLMAVLAVSGGAGQAQAAPQTAVAVQEGVPLTPDQLQQMLPPAVYFQGKTATLQLRNAGAVKLPGGGMVWAALVDTSGYSSGVQERYQFYLVTEDTLLFGGKRLPPGAYGAGFVGERFGVMDIGGHTVVEGATEEDAGMKRPRPLQVLAGLGSGTARLCLGRRCVSLAAGR